MHVNDNERNKIDFHKKTWYLLCMHEEMKLAVESHSLLYQKMCLYN